MKCLSATVASLAVLLAATPACGEYRAVLVQVKQEKGKAVVTIRSDDRKDRRAAASLDEASRPSVP